MKKIASFTLILFAALLFSAPARAQGPAAAVEAVPVEGEGISLAPARFEAEMAPGSETTFVVSLNYRAKEGARQPTRINVSLQDWGMTRDGQVEFAPAGSRPDSASRWILYSPSEAAVLPGQQNSIRVTISVPADAKPGDHLAALVVEPRPDNLKTKGRERHVSVRYRMAAMIYVKVPGLTRRGCSLEGLKASADERGVSVTPTLRNEGNTVVRPLYGVRVLDSAGRVVAELPTSESLPVLAGAELSQTLWLAAGLAPGRYSVRYKVNFQDGGKETEGVTDLFVHDPASKRLIAEN